MLITCNVVIKDTGKPILFHRAMNQAGNEVFDEAAAINIHFTYSLYSND